jgi:hypothetical protein
MALKAPLKLVDQAQPFASRGAQDANKSIGQLVDAFNALRIFRAEVPPASAQRGDVVIRSTSGPGEYVGWYCTTGGKNATWKEWGPISL